jgi:hypothetical protein
VKSKKNSYLPSEILASLNFNKKKNLVPSIGEQPYIKMLLQLCSNIPKYIRVVGKTACVVLQSRAQGPDSG